MLSSKKLTQGQIIRTLTKKTEPETTSASDQAQVRAADNQRGTFITGTAVSTVLARSLGAVG